MNHETSLINNSNPFKYLVDFSLVWLDLVRSIWYGLVVINLVWLVSLFRLVRFFRVWFGLVLLYGLVWLVRCVQVRLG